MTTAPRRLPRHSNSLKDIGRLLSSASTTYEVSRADRLGVHSTKLNDTDGNARNDYFKIQTANLFLRRFGVTRKQGWQSPFGRGEANGFRNCTVGSINVKF
jgi:hypothetical protein